MVSEETNICPPASMIVTAQVKFGRVELPPEMIQTLRIGAEPAIDALFRVGQGQNDAVHTDSMNHVPLVGVGVLEFVKDNERKHGGDERSDTKTAVKDFSSEMCKKIETHSTFFIRQPLALFSLALLLLRPLCISKFGLAFVPVSDSG